MAIVNITNLMKSGIGNVSKRVRSIGRGIGQEASEIADNSGGMIGMNIARANLGLFTGVGIGGIGGATLMTKFSGWLKGNDTGSGNIGQDNGSGRFGNLSSNIGYNRIKGFRR